MNEFTAEELLSILEALASADRYDIRNMKAKESAARKIEAELVRRGIPIEEQ